MHCIAGSPNYCALSYITPATHLTDTSYTPYRYAARPPHILPQPNSVACLVLRWWLTSNMLLMRSNAYLLAETQTTFHTDENAFSLLSENTFSPLLMRQQLSQIGLRPQSLQVLTMQGSQDKCSQYKCSQCKQGSQDSHSVCQTGLPPPQSHCAAQNHHWVSKNQAGGY